ncbi:MAG: hypothetical protein GYA39_02205 [Methanothrix sp.]|nr:hypothetical protein [Methanothrix sp.]
MKLKNAAIALVMVCLLAAPALSMPYGGGAPRAMHNGMMPSANNLTQEDMNNMTLGELRSMRHGDCMMGCESPMLLMMMDGLTAEDLDNMTLAQIRELKKEKMDELNNMTLAQINDLVQKRIQKRENMTLGELKKERLQLREMARSIGCEREGGCNFPRPDRW